MIARRAKKEVRMRTKLKVKHARRHLQVTHKSTGNPVRELLLTAIERCWDGETPFRELEKALSLTQGEGRHR